MKHSQRGSLELSAFVVTLFCLMSTATARPVTLADLVARHETAVTLSLSPDGRALVYAADGNVEIVPVGSRTVRRGVGKGFLPQWSPDGQRLAFYSETADGIQLVVHDLRTKRNVQVTHLSGGINPDPTTRVAGWVYDAFRYAWAPDNERIVFPSRVPVPSVSSPSSYVRKEGEPLILTTTTPRDWTLSGVFANAFPTAGTIKSNDGYVMTGTVIDRPPVVLVNQLFVVNVRTGQVAQLTHENINFLHPVWHPDGKSIVCASSDNQGPVFGSTAINIDLIDAVTGVRRAVTNGRGVRSRPSFSPDGASIAFLSSERFFTKADVHILSISSGQIRNVTAPLERHVTHFGWLRGKDRLLVTFVDGVYSGRLAVLDGAKGVSQLVELGGDPNVPVAAGEIATAAAKDAYCWRQNDPIRLRSIACRSRGGSAPVSLVSLDSNASDWTLGRVEVIRWTNRRGEPLEGTLLKPVGYRPNIAYPLIVDAYPQMGGSNWLSPMMSNQAWAGSGYMVFRPSAYSADVGR